jgi:hypothetical protein
MTNAFEDLAQYLQQGWYTYKTKKSKTRFYVKVTGFRKWRSSSSYVLTAARYYPQTKHWCLLNFRDITRLGEWEKMPNDHVMMPSLDKAFTMAMLRDSLV